MKRALFTSALFAVLLAASACGPNAAPPAPPTAAVAAPVAEQPAEAPPEDVCGASQYAAMVGVSIAAATFPEGVRVIGPDTIVTEDYVPARLNVLVDAAGNITGLRCG